MKKILNDNKFETDYPFFVADFMHVDEIYFLML